MNFYANLSDPQCVSSASAEWLTLNFGFFSSFAPITAFYALNPYFSGVSLQDTDALTQT